MLNPLAHSQLIQKPCLLIKPGKLTDAPRDLCIGDDFVLQGLLMEGGDMIPFDDVLSYQGDVIVLEEAAEIKSPQGRSLIGLLVMSPEGKYFGTIQDYFLNEDAEIEEIILSDLRPEKEGASGFLPRQVFDHIGEEVFFVNAEAEDVYRQEKAPHITENLEGLLAKRFGDSVSGLSQRLNKRIKQVDRGGMAQDLARITDQANREFSRILDGVIEQLSVKRMTFDDDDYSAILHDLYGHTVAKPILDKRGEVILMPGQRISEERIRKVVAAEKVADLYRLAKPIEEL